jgi:hypothetical protein
MRKKMEVEMVEGGEGGGAGGRGAAGGAVAAGEKRAAAVERRVPRQRARKAWQLMI